MTFTKSFDRIDGNRIYDREMLLQHAALRPEKDRGEFSMDI